MLDLKYAILSNKNNLTWRITKMLRGKLPVFHSQMCILSNNLGKLSTVCSSENYKHFMKANKSSLGVFPSLNRLIFACGQLRDGAPPAQ